MIISPGARLFLLVLAGVVPRWQLFFTTSTDYSLRGLAMPMIDSIGIACVVIIARTRNPLVDGEDQPVKTEIVNHPGDPVIVKDAPPTPPKAPIPPLPPDKK